jgi:hypothetical protein
LGIVTSTVYRYFTEVLGLKRRYLNWVAHTLTPAHKVMRSGLDESRVQAQQSTAVRIIISCSQVTNHGYYIPMIIERDGSLLGMMLMKLSNCRLSIRKPCSSFFHYHKGIENPILPER